LYFLTCKNRHLWRHHYFGTQGIIFVVSCKQYINTLENLINEVMTVFKDENLIDVPFLILFDKANKKTEDLEINEKLRSQLKGKDYNYNIQFVNFDDVKGLNEIFYGIDWLCEVMKPVE
jgi:GTPase SAR1 family protein